MYFINSSLIQTPKASSHSKPRPLRRAAEQLLHSPFFSLPRIWFSAVVFIFVQADSRHYVLIIHFLNYLTSKFTLFLPIFYLPHMVYTSTSMEIDTQAATEMCCGGEVEGEVAAIGVVEDENLVMLEDGGGAGKKSLDRVKGPWSPDEDSMLSQLVSNFGARNWSLIARGIPGRSGKSCRLRWCNQLDPAVKRKPFTGNCLRRIIL